eukprot:gnl/Trimastix_PCT/4029.p1 GENE.gnl/Trimastix_PCT/4029~~gnl/Trimastix_PCT/4029.p1  ORF type:complete len:272 (+),score=36.69 gnl/Trimastix_PCT/4029:134-949(+)
MSNEASSTEILEFARHLAQETGQIALRYQKTQGFSITDKISHYDIVTDADQECERHVITQIRERFPEHYIVSEETRPDPEQVTEDTYTWVIDPIDGTTNFAQGLPLFAVSIGVAKGHVPVVGAIDAPALGLTFSAAQGQGAYCNGERISCQEKPFRDCALATGFGCDRGALFDSMTQFVHAITPRCRSLRICGTACLDACFAACGRHTAYMEPALKMWDYAASAIIAREAGCTVTRINGSELSPLCHGSILIAAPALHTQLHDAAAPHHIE